MLKIHLKEFVAFYILTEWPAIIVQDIWISISPRQQENVVLDDDDDSDDVERKIVAIAKNEKKNKHIERQRKNDLNFYAVQINVFSWMSLMLYF